MRIRSLPFFLLSLLLFIPQSAFSQRTDAPPPPVIIVNGNAEIEAVPDEATVRLGVVRQSPTAQAAQEQANTVSQQILNAITKLGIPQQRVQTSRLTLTPVYAPQRPENREAPRIVSYTASNIVSVDIDKLNQIGPVIDAGLTAGANQLEGVQFRLKNDLPAREQALKKAVTEARQKAETIAEALGVRLGPVTEVAEGGVSVVPMAAMGGFAEARVATLAAQTPVSPGQLEVRANVTVKFRIEPR
jgi:uncharacterized protein YggE